MTKVSLVKFNTVPEYRCYACCDEGGYDIHHWSTDAVIGWKKCEVCPPPIPVWKRWWAKWGETSREIWIDHPAVVAKRKLEEVPF